MPERFLVSFYFYRKALVHYTILLGYMVHLSLLPCKTAIALSPHLLFIKGEIQMERLPKIALG